MIDQDKGNLVALQRLAQLHEGRHDLLELRRLAVERQRFRDGPVLRPEIVHRIVQQHLGLARRRLQERIEATDEIAVGAVVSRPADRGASNTA